MNLKQLVAAPVAGADWEWNNWNDHDWNKWWRVNKWRNDDRL